MIEALPTAALGEGCGRRRTGTSGRPVLVLLAWLVAAGLAAWKGFRWTSVKAAAARGRSTPEHPVRCLRFCGSYVARCVAALAIVSLVMNIAIV